MRERQNTTNSTRLDDWLTGRYSWATVAAAAILAVLTILPVLWSAFYGDDSWLCLQGHTLYGMTHGSIVKDVVQTQLSWMRLQGRLFPLSSYVYFLFYAVNGNAFVYKSFIVLLVVANLLLFRLFVVRVTRSRGLGLLAMLVAPLAFQVRYGDDPLTSYHGLMQMVVLYTLVGLVCLVSYIDTGKRWYLVAGALSYAASLLTYEVGLPFFLMYFLVAWLYPTRGRLRDAAKASWPFALAAVLAAAIALALRLYFDVAITGDAASAPYASNPSLLAAMGPLFKQTTAAIPLSYYVSWLVRDSWNSGFIEIAEPMPGFLGTLRTHPFAGLFLVLGYGTLVTGACVAIVRGRFEGKPPRPAAHALVAAGVCLLVLPGVLIAMSPKYQSIRWIRWGFPYIPVYASYFGVAALFAVGLYLLLMKSKGTVAWRVVTGVTVVLAVFVGVVNYGNTASVVTGWKSAYVYAREAEENALQRGLMQDFPNGAGLISPPSNWEAGPAFFRLNANREVGVFGQANALNDDLTGYASETSQTPTGTAYIYAPAKPLFALYYKGDSENNGHAVFGKLNSFVVGADGSFSEMAFVPIRAYLQWNSSGPMMGPDQIRYDSPAIAGLAEGEWETERRGTDWAVYVPKSAVSSTTP